MGPPSPAMPIGKWRSELCEMTGSHLCQHENVALRPRLRDETYKELKVAEDQHSRAFLEHHKHATAILKFLIQRAGLRSVAHSRYFRIVVYSCCDGTMANPFDDALVCDFIGSSDMPALD